MGEVLTAAASEQRESRGSSGPISACIAWRIGVMEE
jgi:hypothetical protein